MKMRKLIGWLLITGAVGVIIPYTILIMIFEYPAILHQEAGVILTKFHAGGATLIFTWFAFAIIGLPLLPAYLLIGKVGGNKSVVVSVAATIGVVGLLVQMIGLLRWVFVVPVLANTFVSTTDESIRTAAVIAFKAVHQFGGVLLGEHLGQLFTIISTVIISISFAKLKLFPNWINGLGIIGAVIYLLAQAELFATVIPGFPVWDLAGVIGSTLWLVWLIVLGVHFIIKADKN